MELGFTTILTVGFFMHKIYDNNLKFTCILLITQRIISVINFTDDHNKDMYVIEYCCLLMIHIRIQFSLVIIMKNNVSFTDDHVKVRTSFVA